jgi:DNA polymerase-3 subunit chi
VSTEIGFYHLTRQTRERALARLLGRTLATGHRAVVLATDTGQVRELDDALWQQTDVDWLPHGTSSQGEADLQPIWLTETDMFEAGSPNGADFLFLLGLPTKHAGRFARVFDLFDGRQDDEVQRARARWTEAKASGHSLAYWRETPTGWERAQ